MQKVEGRRLTPVLGHGIINSDGELWRVQRKAGLAFLNTKNLQVLTDVALPRYLAQSVDLLKATSEDCREADLQVVFHEITSQLMGKMAYNVGFLRPPLTPLALAVNANDVVSSTHNPYHRWKCMQTMTSHSPSTSPRAPPPNACRTPCGRSPRSSSALGCVSPSPLSRLLGNVSSTVPWRIVRPQVGPRNVVCRRRPTT